MIVTVAFGNLTWPWRMAHEFRHLQKGYQLLGISFGVAIDDKPSSNSTVCYGKLPICT